MAQPQVIDYNLMYKVGQAVAPGHERYKQQQTPWLAKAAFNIIGGEVLGYMKDTKARRRAYTDKNAIFDATIAASIAEDVGMSEIYNDAAQEFSALRDEGQKLVARYHGFPNSKKYKKGVALMNKAQSSLENLQMDAQTKLTLQNQFKSVEKDGVILEDGKPRKTQYAKYNTSKIDDRTMMFTTGELDQHFQVNPDTGHLELVEEDDSNFLKIKPEGMSDEEYAKYAESYVPEIKTTTFGDIQFNKFQDSSALDLLSTARTNGISYGDTGIEWDNTLQTGLYADARQSVDQLTPAAFKSWFFSGTNYNFANSGKTFMTPAEQFLKEKFPELEPGSVGYIGAMESLKEQDLLDGNEYKEYAVKQIMDVTKQFHEVSKSAYDKKHEKVYKKTTQPQEKPKIVDGKNLGYSHSAAIAEQMYSGAGTVYSLDKDNRFKYEQDGKGYTTIYELEEQFDKDGYSTGFEYVNRGQITTEEAVNKRGLANIYDSPYTAITDQKQKEQQEQTDEDLLKQLNTKEKTVVKMTDMTGQEVDSSGDLPKGVYFITYDDGSTKKKVVK